MPWLNATSPTTSFTACILAPVMFLKEELDTMSAMRSASYTAAYVLFSLPSGSYIEIKSIRKRRRRRTWRRRKKSTEKKMRKSEIVGVTLKEMMVIANLNYWLRKSRFDDVNGLMIYPLILYYIISYDLKQYGKL